MDDAMSNPGKVWFDSLSDRAKMLLRVAAESPTTVVAEVKMLSALAAEAFAMATDATSGADGLEPEEVRKRVDMATKTLSASVKAKRDLQIMTADGEDLQNMLSPTNVRFTVIRVSDAEQAERRKALGLTTATQAEEIEEMPLPERARY